MTDEDVVRASPSTGVSPPTGAASTGATAGAPTAWSCLATVLAPLTYVHVVLGLAGIAAGVAAVVLARRRDAAAPMQRLAVFALGLAVLVMVRVPFPVWVVVGLLAVAARRWDWVRPVDGWLPVGEVDRLTRVAGAAVVVGAGVALTVWARWTDTFGEGTLQLVELLRSAPLVALVPLGALFAVVNAVAEEIAYRSIVQDAVTAVWGPGVAVVVQAGAFGVLHVAGFPAGVVGMVLATVYGLVLGVLRMRTGGLRVPVVVHVAADVTIAALVWLLVVPAVA